MLEKIKMAVDNVSDEFYQTMFINDENTIKTCYRERVFCYELYYQMRKTIQCKDFCINGEIDKRGNNSFKNSINPDFIIHKQGSNDNNLYVIEVKLNLDKDGIYKDFDTLTEMVNEHNYKNAVFILINHNFAELKNRIKLKKSYLKEIVILCKKSHNEQVEQHTLDELMEESDVNKR